MKKGRLLTIVGFVGLILILLALPLVGCAEPAPPVTPPVTPETAKEFYEQNVLTIINPWSPGGGADFASRLWGSYWSDYVEGGHAIVENEAGAAGMVATNRLYKAKPDPLIVEVHDGTGLMAPAIFNDPACQYDPAKFVYLGLFGSSPTMVGVGVQSPYETIEDLLAAEEVVFGASTAATDTGVGVKLFADLGVKARIVLGYGGTSEMGLALGRGEIDALFQSAGAFVDFMDKDFAKKPLAVMDFRRTACFPDVPAITELVQVTPEVEKLLTFMVAIQSSKPMFMIPGVPQDRVDFMRDIFDKIVADEYFVKQAKLRWTVWEEPIPGLELGEVIQKTITAFPPEETARLLQDIQNMAVIK